MREQLRSFSLTPLDQSTPEGRSGERDRRIALSAAASAMAKILSIGTALISVPLSLGYLGQERFGMWAIISSLIAMLAFADFGLGNGVLSAVAKAHGNDDAVGTRRVVSTGFFLLCGVALVLVALFALAYPWFNWHALFNVQTAQARAEAGPALAMFVLCFAGSIPLGVVQRVQWGLQQGFVASLWQCAGSLCGLLGMLLVIYLGGSLPWLVLALAGAPLAAALLNSLFYFFWHRPDLRPRWSCCASAALTQIASSGVLFFVLQVVGAVVYTSDSLIVAQLMGAAAVAEYVVPEKMFSLISLTVATLTVPLWPAYGEAIERGDLAWVQRTFYASIRIAVGTAALMSLLLLAAGSFIIQLWVGELVFVPFSLLLGLAIWKVVEATGNCLAMLLNGTGKLKLQVIMAIVTAIVAISLKFIFIHEFGVPGVVWATLIAYGCSVSILYYFYVRSRIFSGASG